jgi:hypothetical protein
MICYWKFWVWNDLLHVLLLWASCMLILWNVVCLKACLTILCESNCDGNDYMDLENILNAF